MKKKDLEQLKNRPMPELQKQLKEWKDKLWQMRVDLVAGKVKNVREIRAVRKDIARLLTFIKANE